MSRTTVGVKRLVSSLSIAIPEIFPSSTNDKRFGHPKLYTRELGANFLINFFWYALFAVKAVDRIANEFRFDMAAAVLTTGTTPIIGILGNHLRYSSIPAIVAVLQATTIS